MNSKKENKSKQATPRKPTDKIWLFTGAPVLYRSPKKMNFYIHIAAFFVATISISVAALPLPIPDLVTKEWHSSPPIAITSQIFGVIEWDKMPMIKIRITEQALHGISPTLSTFKNASALIYSMSPAGICYEIGVLIDRGHVSDISYKVSEDVKMHRTFSASISPLNPHR